MKKRRPTTPPTRISMIIPIIAKTVLEEAIRYFYLSCCLSPPPFADLSSKNNLIEHKIQNKWSELPGLRAQNTEGEIVSEQDTVSSLINSLRTERNLHSRS
jgi:hypothetical protein